jgi:beta-glucosidase
MLPGACRAADGKDGLRGVVAMNTNHPWYDSALPIEERVERLVAAMTLREKIAQMLHQAPPIPRLGVPAYCWWNEGLHGVSRAGQATVFPQAIGMAASFNDGLLQEVASAIADEGRAKHHEAARRGQRGIYFGLTFWSPNINLFRDPRWGRGQETYGEDPHLTARMGVAYCRGLQGNHPRYLKLVATIKHFAVHSGPESLRHCFNAEIEPRDLRESYLPHFEACVREGRAASVMGAYNRLNGEPCCGSPSLLQQILREEWGFDGFVVSDCWAIKDFHEAHKVTGTPAESAALAVRSGCDLNCGDMYRNLMQAVEEGLVDEQQIDSAVKRLFTARMKLGMFDPEAEVPYASIPASVVRCRKHVNLALRMARESIVLLKNNGVLPLRKSLSSIAVVGPNARSPVALEGNYNGYSPQPITPFDAIVDKVSVGTRVSYHPGCDLWRDEPVHEEGFGWSIANDTEMFVAIVGRTAEIEGEEGMVPEAVGGGDRTGLELPGRQMEFLRFLKKSGKPLVVVVMSGGPLDVREVETVADAIIWAWYPGEQGGVAIADVLFGDYNPAGRLPVTFVKSLDDLPPFTEYAMKGRTYRFMEAEPLYRFGYGLSYTRFDYSDLKITIPLAGKDALQISVNVKNIGLYDGDEVVQVYVKDRTASVPVPRHSLVAFQRIHLTAGALRQLDFEISMKDAFKSYDDNGKRLFEPGNLFIHVGGGQLDDPHLPGIGREIALV